MLTFFHDLSHINFKILQNKNHVRHSHTLTIAGILYIFLSLIHDIALTFNRYDLIVVA